MAEWAMQVSHIRRTAKRTVARVTCSGRAPPTAMYGSGSDIATATRHAAANIPAIDPSMWIEPCLRLRNAVT